MSLFRRQPRALPFADDSPEGLAARWVRWAASTPVARNPVADGDGRYADLNQPEDVWFLAGTFGTTVVRRCTVPAGRRLFMPAVNVWNLYRSGPVKELPGAFGLVGVDGVDQPAEPIATPVGFEVAGARGNPVTQTWRPIRVSVWGLWRLLPPLPAGLHTVRILGGAEGFQTGATYHLTVG